MRLALLRARYPAEHRARSRGSRPVSAFRSTSSSRRAFRSRTAPSAAPAWIISTRSRSRAMRALRPSTPGGARDRAFACVLATTKADLRLYGVRLRGDSDIMILGRESPPARRSPCACERRCAPPGASAMREGTALAQRRACRRDDRWRGAAADWAPFLLAPPLTFTRGACLRMKPRVLVVVTHLLGVGHLARAALIARALVEAGRERCSSFRGGKPSATVDLSRPRRQNRSAARALRRLRFQDAARPRTASSRGRGLSRKRGARRCSTLTQHGIPAPRASS